MASIKQQLAHYTKQSCLSNDTTYTVGDFKFPLKPKF